MTKAIIREATMADRFAVLRLSREFVEALDLLPFDAPYVEHTVKQCIASDDKLCLVFEPHGTVQGFLMAHAASHPFWPVKAASELAWWVNQHHRQRKSLRLIDFYEDWAREQDCKLVGLVHLGDERLSRFYRRRGYAATDTHFLKAL